MVKKMIILLCQHRRWVMPPISVESHPGPIEISPITFMTKHIFQEARQARPRFKYNFRWHVFMQISVREHSINLRILHE